MNGSTPLLEARAVTRRYRAGDGRPFAAVDAVSITVPRGAFAVVTGASGSGKSTLLALLGALDRPTSGEVHFDGVDLARVSDAERTRIRRRIGFVFQSFPMIRRLPVWENVTYPLVPLGIASEARRVRAEAILARLSISPLADKRPETLSGGECQRVGLARALIANPAAILADEPTSNLDAKSAESLVRLFGELHAEGTTLFVATHDSRLVALASTTLTIEAGRLIS